MKERIFTEWKSSLIGVCFIIFGGVLIWTEKADITSAMVLIGIGLGCLGIKDSIFK